MLLLVDNSYTEEIIQSLLHVYKTRFSKPAKFTCHISDVLSCWSITVQDASECDAFNAQSVCGFSDQITIHCVTFIPLFSTDQLIPGINRLTVVLMLVFANI